MFYVEHMLPQIIWMAYILDDLGDQDGFLVIKDMVRSAYELKDWEKKPELTLISTYGNLTDVDRASLLAVWRRVGVLSDIRHGLRVFLRTYPRNNPLGFVADRHCHRGPTRGDIAKARRLVADSISRWSHRAVVLQSLVPVCELLVGKMSIAPHLKVPDFDIIFHEPDSDEGQQVAGFIRCMVSQVVEVHRPEFHDTWCADFWNRGLEIQDTHLEIDRGDVSPSREKDPVAAFASRYYEVCVSAIETVWRGLPKNLLAGEEAEVVGALLARQCHLTLKLSSVSLWDWSFGPLFLRAMTDAYITLAWILGDPLDRSRKFIDYGLGQEKLQAEHLREQSKHV